MGKRISFIFLAIIALLIILPLSLLFFWSFNGKWMYPTVFPEQYTLKVLHQMISETNFFPAILNTLVIALGATIGSLLIALPAARYFAFQKKWSQRFVEILIYLPLILPTIAITTSSQILFLRFHLTGSFSGIILIHIYFCLPYAMQILLESYRKMGEGYSITAYTLGAGSLRTFRLVTWPLLRPGIITSASLVFIVSCSQYLPTFFIGGGRIVTLPLLLLPYANNGRLGIASAYSLIFLGCTIVGVFILKMMIGGMNHGRKYS
ncbi:hypothetical protein RV04_GL000975 [Enterococcus hermanniensis]|uniref:ABC transmembrane type-1 domain-containing protein n=2 Tax=Enterococcus hermanniensis TaxID=249189 RepID=A0A1L8TQI5_9ENTE|nr:hypothetical protein RV04_GL000975 [Enterococcus hermanniensis]